MPELPGNIQLRKPTQSELDFFRSRPDIPGMASSDNKVIMNPFSTLSDAALDSVRLNEAARVFMRIHNIIPTFSITPEQESAFQSYGSPLDIRSTIADRILSNDPSALSATDDQKMFVSRLSEKMGIPSSLSGAIRSRGNKLRIMHMPIRRGR